MKFKNVSGKWYFGWYSDVFGDGKDFFMWVTKKDNVYRTNKQLEKDGFIHNVDEAEDGFTMKNGRFILLTEEDEFDMTED